MNMLQLQENINFFSIQERFIKQRIKRDFSRVSEDDDYKLRVKNKVTLGDYTVALKDEFDTTIEWIIIDGVSERLS